MKKTVCDRCKEDCDVEEGDYTLKHELSKIGDLTNDKAKWIIMDLCGYCAAQFRLFIQLPAKIKAKEV